MGFLSNKKIDESMMIDVVIEQKSVGSEGQSSSTD